MSTKERNDWLKEKYQETEEQFQATLKQVSEKISEMASKVGSPSISSPDTGAFALEKSEEVSAYLEKKKEALREV